MKYPPCILDNYNSCGDMELILGDDDPVDDEEGGFFGGGVMD